MNSEQNDINANNCRTVNSRQFTHNSSLSTVHSLAFTLAETLIVMGIIGVVAALTIPNVNKNTNNAEKVAKVKKLYAELSEAFDRATAVYGPIETWNNNINFVPSLYSSLERITEFMIVQKVYTKDSYLNIPCVYYLSGEEHYCEYSTESASAILNSGATLTISDSPSKYSRCVLDDDYNGGYDGSCGYIYIDIDGPKKGKNILGIDWFGFVITKNGIQPSGGGNWWNDEKMKDNCFSGGDVYGANTSCTAWVINTGNMDYLDASHDESDAGKCKHSNKTLSIDNNVFSCK